MRMKKDFSKLNKRYTFLAGFLPAGIAYKLTVLRIKGGAK